MSEIKGCMNCGNISCGNNKKRESAGCGRWISPEDKIAELGFEYQTAKELLKQWLQTSQNNACDNVALVAETEKFLKE